MPAHDPRIVDVANAVLAAYDTLQPKTAEERAGNAQLISHLKSWFKTGTRQISPSATAVANRFVDAELDFNTPGNRGMGRMTDYWPRFGGKHRQILRKISGSDLQEVHRLFARQIHCGYLFTEYLVETFNGSDMARDRP